MTSVLITCSMLIEREKAWEILSHAMMSGRQRSEVRGQIHRG